VVACAMVPPMSLRVQPAHAGRQRAKVLRSLIGRELRVARLAIGLTQRVVAQRAGLSQGAISQIERDARGFSLSAYARAVAAVGHELSVRVFPAASVSLRDRGQLELAQRIAMGMSPGWSCELEAPISPDGLRAADLLCSSANELCLIEIFRSMADFQAQLRPAQLKREALASRHSRPVHLVIAVPDTVTVRRRIREFGGLVNKTLPVSSQRIWSALRNGGLIGGDGIVFVRPRLLPPSRCTAY